MFLFRSFWSKVNFQELQFLLMTSSNKTQLLSFHSKRILTDFFVSSWQIILELFQNLLCSYNVLVREWQSILLLKQEIRKRKENFVKIKVWNKDFVMKSLTFCRNRLVLHLRKLQNGTSKKKIEKIYKVSFPCLFLLGVILLIQMLIGCPYKLIIIQRLHGR